MDFISQLPDEKLLIIALVLAMMAIVLSKQKDDDTDGW